MGSAISVGMGLPAGQPPTVCARDDVTQRGLDQWDWFHSLHTDQDDAARQGLGGPQQERLRVQRGAHPISEHLKYGKLHIKAFRYNCRGRAMRGFAFCEGKRAACGSLRLATFVIDISRSMTSTSPRRFPHSTTASKRTLGSRAHRLGTATPACQLSSCPGTSGQQPINGEPKEPVAHARNYQHPPPFDQAHIVKPHPCHPRIWLLGGLH